MFRHVVSLLFLLPAAGLVVADDGPLSSLEKARAGQWVFHRSIETDGATSRTAHSYNWVDKVEDRKVFLETQSVDATGKKGLSRPLGSIALLDEKPPGPVAERPTASATAFEEIIVNGKKLSCKKTTTVTTDPLKGKVTQIVWSCSEVPLYGVVKRLTLDKNDQELFRLDLLDWGDTGGSARPVEKDERDMKDDKGTKGRDD